MMRAGRQTSPPSGKAELQGHDDTGLGPLHNQGVQDNHWDRGEVLSSVPLWPAGALGGASDALNYIIKEPSTTQSCKDLPASVPLNQVCKWSSIPAQGQGCVREQFLLSTS